MAGWLQAAWTWMAFDVSGSSALQSWYSEMMGIMMMNPISIIPSTSSGSRNRMDIALVTLSLCLC